MVNPKLPMSPSDFVNNTQVNETAPGIYNIDTTYMGRHYNQTISSKPLPTLNPNITNTTLTHPELAFSQRQPLSPLYDETIYDMPPYPNNTVIAQPTQGTAGQYNAQFASLPPVSSNVGTGKAAIPISSMQYTNTTQSSSSGVTPEQYLGYLASTVGSLANRTLSVPGYTPGGALLAGGQFPSNCTLTQTDINKTLTNPDLAQGIQN